MSHIPEDPGRGVSREEIETRAYELYLLRGGEHGHDEEDWFLAEIQLLEEHAAVRQASDPLKSKSAKT